MIATVLHFLWEVVKYLLLLAGGFVAICLMFAMVKFPPTNALLRRIEAYGRARAYARRTRWPSRGQRPFRAWRLMLVTPFVVLQTAVIVEMLWEHRVQFGPIFLTYVVFTLARDIAKGRRGMSLRTWRLLRSERRRPWRGYRPHP